MKLVWTGFLAICELDPTAKLDADELKFELVARPIGLGNKVVLSLGGWIIWLDVRLGLLLILLLLVLLLLVELRLFIPEKKLFCELNK